MAFAPTGPNARACAVTFTVFLRLARLERLGPDADNMKAPQPSPAAKTVSLLSFSRRPPRLVVRTLVTTSAAIGAVLIAVFVVLSMDARSRAMGTAIENLDAAQRVFAEFEQHRQQETLIKLNALAENRSLAAAVRDYRRTSGVSATCSASWTTSRGSSP